MKDQEKIQTLIDLGLTSREARVYLALFHLGKSTTKQISESSNVNREDLYRILSALEDLSLVEKVINVPVAFRAIPISNALEILFEHKTDKLYGLQRRINNLRMAEENFELMKPNKDKSEVVLIPEKEAIILRRRNAIANAQMSMDIINTWKRHVQAEYFFREEMKKTLKRGVEVRLIIDKPENATNPIATALKKSPFFKFRYISANPSALVSIYDKKCVFITALLETPLGGSPAFWTNNPCLLTIAQEYFECMWLRASEKILCSNED